MVNLNRALALGTAFAGPLKTSRDAASLSTVTPCAEVASYFTKGLPTSAKLAYDCLTSVPFNATLATEFVGYYRDVLTFQSTVAYLKDPPPSYQQPAVDLLGGLDRIQSMIQNGTFRNEYQWESALLSLVRSGHDSHLRLALGATAAIHFISPLLFATISSDGLAIPQVYSLTDITAIQAADISGWTPSPAVQINGMHAIAWLDQYAKTREYGCLEPNCDWNSMMFDAAHQLSNNEGSLISTIFYPGEKLRVVFENGSIFEGPFMADTSRASSWAKIHDGADFYAEFVEQASHKKRSAPSSAARAVFATGGWSAMNLTAYPRSVLEQSGLPSPGLVFSRPRTPDVRGYFVNSTVAVMSVPSFAMFTRSQVHGFQGFAEQFPSMAKAAGIKRMIVDLRGNLGGHAGLAYDLFKRFFPNIEPYAGSRMRASGFVDALGNTATNYYKQAVAANATDITGTVGEQTSVWVAPVWLDGKTGKSFDSWQSLFGPHIDHGDAYTSTQRLNLSNVLQDMEYGISDPDLLTGSPPPFAADDIVLLMDGICASTCALFYELMTSQGGVKDIVMGGRPVPGPMQGNGEVRGALSYSIADLDHDFGELISHNASLASVLPSFNHSAKVEGINFNLRDQIRKDENFPLQFAYEPSSCRLFYTAQTLTNYTALWTTVADSVWGKHGPRCVKDSMNQGGNGTNTLGPLYGNYSMGTGRRR